MANEECVNFADENTETASNDNGELSEEMKHELEILGQTVSAVSNQEYERQFLTQLTQNEDLDDFSDQPGPSSKFDQLMQLPDSIRLGEKTPFELKQEEGDADSHEEGELTESEEEYLPSDVEVEDKGDYHIPKKRKADSDNFHGKPKSKKPRLKKVAQSSDLTFKDDGNDNDFENRIRRVMAQKEFDRLQRTEAGCPDDEDEGEDEQHAIKHGISLTSSVWNKLFKYQKTGVRWLCELNEQGVGGILADEMGLGKTIQMIAFLRALDESRKRDSFFGLDGLGPTLIICPATLMHQWVRELHIWMPMCRVAVLHSSGSYIGPKQKLTDKMAAPRKGGSVLITSYSTFTNEQKMLLKKDWHYVILDEGHKIRNPEAKITLAVKELRTPFRIILSGSPMQNSLRELWSLIDFVYPDRLGSLKTFMTKFSIPITQGGYANATKIQAMTAYKCAMVLREAINPFILRRFKCDVQQVLDLPKKNEQVLFCDITEDQRTLYKEYLASRECHRILNGKMDAFVGLILLRKLCNHPDLITGGPNKHGEFNVVEDPSKEFGWYERSGKMQVTKNLLSLWKKLGSKGLIFSQSRQMLDILERMVIIEGYSYLRMDGSSNIGHRQQMVHQFNNDPSIDFFLLTTRVGGLGVNLTGANKVLIFDPDWNPSTDAQARERAFRIGQKRDVTIFRLVTSGTIEEKIFHRQLFKQFLTNRVLKNPKQRRFFKTNDLHELFTLADASHKGTETGTLFSGETEEINRHNFFDRHEKQRESAREARRKKTKEPETGVPEEGELTDDEDSEEVRAVELSEERKQQLREMARKMAKDPTLVTGPSSDNQEPRKHEDKKKERRKSRKRLLDGKYDIPYLKKQKKANIAPDDEDIERDRKATDDYVLGSLLKNAGVRSVLQHDDLVGEKLNYDVIEKEAEAIARQAAAAVRSRPKLGYLHQLREGRRSTHVVAGTSAEKEDKPMFSGKSGSGDFIDAIQRRKRNQIEEVPEMMSQNVDNKFTRLASDVKGYINSKGGTASTNDIIEKFKNKIGTHESAQFRAILKEIAILNKHRKEWTLRDDFT